MRGGARSGIVLFASRPRPSPPVRACQEIDEGGGQKPDLSFDRVQSREQPLRQQVRAQQVQHPDKDEDHRPARKDSRSKRDAHQEHHHERERGVQMIAESAAGKEGGAWPRRSRTLHPDPRAESSGGSSHPGIANGACSLASSPPRVSVKRAAGTRRSRFNPPVPVGPACRRRRRSHPALSLIHI